MMQKGPILYSDLVHGMFSWRMKSENCHRKDFIKSGNRRMQYRLQSCETNFCESPGSPLSTGVNNIKLLLITEKIMVCPITYNKKDIPSPYDNDNRYVQIIYQESLVGNMLTRDLKMFLIYSINQPLWLMKKHGLRASSVSERPYKNHKLIIMALQMSHDEKSC